ncbi:MAG: HAD family hydrolase [Planctomycetota bacterium]|jgi:beta-phosphoglucomutase
MLKAVIFDFDGVITDSEILHLRSFNRVLAQQYGVEIETKAYYKDYLGLTDFECFSKVADERQLALDNQQLANLMKQKTQIFEELATAEGRIIEGVRDFLKMLEQNNILMAICSGAVLAEIELILEEARLRHLFAVIVSAEQVTKGKPDPEGFLLALEKLNQNRQNAILPNQCIVIEDSHWGLKAAKAAEMHTIAVTNSYAADQLTQAEKIVTRLDELNIDELQQLCC